MTPVAAIVVAALAYLSLGILVGGVIVLVASGRVDRRLAAAPLSVKVFLLPGAVVLWPMVLRRARRGVS